LKTAFSFQLFNPKMFLPVEGLYHLVDKAIAAEAALRRPTSYSACITRTRTG
jgi:hypothetical protein